MGGTRLLYLSKGAIVHGHSKDSLPLCGVAQVAKVGVGTDALPKAVACCCQRTANVIMWFGCDGVSVLSHWHSLPHMACHARLCAAATTAATGIPSKARCPCGCNDVEELQPVHELDNERLRGLRRAKRVSGNRSAVHGGGEHKTLVPG